MTKSHNEYLRYTEYYIMSGAYHIVNVVNEILTQSACYSVNIKEYLRNQVASKEVALNEAIRNNNHGKLIRLNDNDVDEDGFVVIKMRKHKHGNGNGNNGNGHNIARVTTGSDNQMVKDVEEIIEKIISDIIRNLDYQGCKV